MTESSNHYVGAGLRLRLGAAGLTQQEFANRLGVQRPTVVRWLAGIRIPEPGTRPAIDRVLAGLPATEQLGAADLERIATALDILELVDDTLERDEPASYFAASADEFAAALDKIGNLGDTMHALARIVGRTS